MVDRGSLTLELTTTALCDMNCTYCFEGVKSNPKRLEQLDLLIDRIKEIMNTEWFNEHYSALTLSFWGGEPTLNTNYIIKLMNAFDDDSRVHFMTYTNGYNVNNIKKIVENTNYKKLKVQVSYDGRIISDIFRLNNKGKTTSDKVLETFDFLAHLNMDVSLKATLPHSAIGHLYETWLDFEKLHKQYEGYNNVRINFAPTMDYAQNWDGEKELEDVELFRKQIIKIAKEEIRFFKEHKRHLMSWFNGQGKEKANCSAGLNMIGIDVDGKTYVCHGAFYMTNKDQLQSSSIFDDDFINKIKIFNDSFEPAIKEIPKECKECVATTCIVCPINSFENSKKEDKMEKWMDRSANGLCKFYQTFGEIDRSVQKYLKDNENIRSK